MTVLIASIAFLIAYVIGALPTGAWLAQWYGIADITKHGSGNIGATNVGRLFGVFAYLFVLVVDAGKAFLYLKCLKYCTVDYNVLCSAAVALLLGNGFSIFLQWRGGKGVATGLGIIGALAPSLLYGSLSFWVLFLMITNIVGLASIATGIILPFLCFYLQHGNWPLLGLVSFMSIWCIYRHTSNIARYARLEEIKG